MNIVEQFSLGLPFLALWTILFGISYGLENRFVSRSRSFYLTTPVLNLLETLFLQAYGLVYITFYLLGIEDAYEEMVPVLLRSTIAFYLVESLFQLFSGKFYMGMLAHHGVSIFGAIMMLGAPQLNFEICLFIMVSKLSFQYPIQQIFDFFEWEAREFLRINAWWNLSVFVFCRAIILPVYAVFAIGSNHLPLELIAPFLLLIIWGWTFIPKVRRNTLKFLEE